MQNDEPQSGARLFRVHLAIRESPRSDGNERHAQNGRRHIRVVVEETLQVVKRVEVHSAGSGLVFMHLAL
jgi:hypothetical protein